MDFKSLDFTQIFHKISRHFIYFLWTVCINIQHYFTSRRLYFGYECIWKAYEFINGSDHGVVASYLELYEEGKVEHINGVWPVFLIEQLFTVYTPSG